MDKHLNYRGPEAYDNLRNMYWCLRDTRRHSHAAKVRWYRRIKKEKQRLAAIGYSMEHMRLYCRYMSNPVADSPALRRLWAYEQAVIAFGRVVHSPDIIGPDRTVATRRADVQVDTKT